MTMYEYEVIQEYYGEERAERSGQLYIRHIDRGLEILSSRAASELAKRAYCLHPVVQSDRDLKLNFWKLNQFDARVVALAMEYRRVANAYLSKDYQSEHDTIKLSPLPDVNDMLIADKMQNYEDLVLFNHDIPNYHQLRAYFFNWFYALGIKQKDETYVEREC